MYKDIANFLSESPEWVENWISILVKKKLSIDFPDFAVSLFNILPIEHFNRSLKLNQSWYKKYRRELANRQNFWMKRY